ncbi:hypothetical protein C0J52_16648 [Blattella germanica]|nr:hypothetical protein C0J52_16648 [Blattella germanica]
MNILFRTFRVYPQLSIKNVTGYLLKQKFHVTPISRLKEIHETQDGKVRIFEGINVASPRESLMVKNEDSQGCCNICSLGLEVKHTDVLILSQFLRSDGCMLPRRVTGLCRKQQKRMSKMVAMAQKAGLMPNIGPPSSKKDPKRRYKWKKCNTYYDESTIMDVRSITQVKKRW